MQGNMKKATPKAALSNGQRIRKEELISMKDTFPPKFRAAKAKIEERKAAVAAAFQALAEAEEEKKVLEKEYGEVIAELKPLSG